jgi:hypothetical protein
MMGNFIEVLNFQPVMSQTQPVSGRFSPFMLISCYSAKLF